MKMDFTQYPFHQSGCIFQSDANMYTTAIWNRNKTTTVREIEGVCSFLPPPTPSDFVFSLLPPVLLVLLLLKPNMRQIKLSIEKAAPAFVQAVKIASNAKR